MQVILTSSPCLFLQRRPFAGATSLPLHTLHALASGCTSSRSRDTTRAMSVRYATHNLRRPPSSSSAFSLLSTEQACVHHRGLAADTWLLFHAALASARDSHGEGRVQRTVAAFCTVHFPFQQPCSRQPWAWHVPCPCCCHRRTATCASATRSFLGVRSTPPFFVSCGAMPLRLD